MRKALFLLLILAAGGLASGAPHNAETQRRTGETQRRSHLKSVRGSLEAGAAQTDITPPLGFPMAGYFNERLATGVHDPLQSKAIVLRQGTNIAALVFCDLIGIPPEVSSAARQEASRTTGIPRDNILIAATHTHTGPLFQDIRRELLSGPGTSKESSEPRPRTEDYPAFLSERIAQAISAANANLKPADLAAGIAQQHDLSFNRRYHLRDGTVRFNPGRLNPDIVRAAGPIDPDLGLLLLRAAADSKPVAMLSVFACHCDTVGGTQFSADYPHFLECRLREGLEGLTQRRREERKDLDAQRRSEGAEGTPPFVSAFAAGTCGDINHINVAVKQQPQSWAMPETIGNALAETALAKVSTLRRSTRPDLAARSHVLQLKLQTVTPDQVTRARDLLQKPNRNETPFLEVVEAVKVLDLAKRAESSAGGLWPVEVQVFRLDAETAIVGLPGEIFVELGLAIKRQSPFKRTMVLSLCNDRPAYVPTLKAFHEGSYEIVNSRLQAGSGEAMVEAALGMLAELSR